MNFKIIIFLISFTTISCRDFNKQRTAVDTIANKSKDQAKSDTTNVADHLDDSINVLINKNMNDDSNSEYLFFLIYRYFKSNPKGFYSEIDSLEKKLRSYKMTLSDVVCDEMLKDYHGISKIEVANKADSLFSKIKLAVKEKPANFKLLDEIEKACVNCIKNSPEESDPNQLKY